MAEQSKVEKFSRNELFNLRSELMQSGIDTWQAADVVSAFLAGRGYGVNCLSMRDAVTRFDPFSGSVDAMQEVLETVAFVM